MRKAVAIKLSQTPEELRRLAIRTKDANQSRRLRSIAAALDGMRRAAAAKIGGMDRQTLRDWAQRFNERGPDGLKDPWRRDRPRRLSEAQLSALAEIVETGPERKRHGVVRWRRIDLQLVIEERSGVVYHERTVGKSLKHLGFSHISVRPHPPKQDAAGIEALKKLPRDAQSASSAPRQGQTHRSAVPGRSPHRAEERPCPAMGAARNKAAPTRRSALRECLPLRRNRPASRRWGRSCHALRRHRGDAASSRRNIAKDTTGRPRRPPA